MEESRTNPQPTDPQASAPDEPTGQAGAASGPGDGESYDEPMWPPIDEISSTRPAAPPPADAWSAFPATPGPAYTPVPGGQAGAAATTPSHPAPAPAPDPAPTSAAAPTSGAAYAAQTAGAAHAAPTSGAAYAAQTAGAAHAAPTSGAAYAAQTAGAAHAAPTPGTAYAAPTSGAAYAAPSAPGHPGNGYQQAGAAWPQQPPQQPQQQPQAGYGSSYWPDHAPPSSAPPASAPPSGQQPDPTGWVTAQPADPAAGQPVPPPGGWYGQQAEAAGQPPAGGQYSAYPGGTPGYGTEPFPQEFPPQHTSPTADEFAKRRAVRPSDPIATQGVRAAVRRGSMGLLRLGPGRKEQEQRRGVEMVRRNFGGLRQVTVVNPKGGAGKTVAVLNLAMTFGQKRGGYVLAWDNNETQGTLGMRASQDFHIRTVRDLLRDLDHFRGPTGRVGDLSQYVRAQGEAMFDVLASDESATAGEMLTSNAFRDIREVVSRFYKLIVVDTGNNVRAANWQAAIDATDQLVVTMSARNDSAETAARMLDHLEQTGRHDLVRRAVTVVSMPAHRKDLDLPAVQRHFSARTRAVLLAPYEKLLDSGEPIRYHGLSQANRDAWLKIAAAVAEGL